MKKIIAIAALALLGSAGSLLALDAEAVPFRSGETLHFEVKWNGFGIGETQIQFDGLQEWKGQRLFRVFSKAKTVKYEGVDEIYADPETFLPVYVRRELTFMGKDEVIEEFYDQSAHKVSIVKTVNGETETSEIVKEGPITNSILLYYLVRMKKPRLKDSLDVQLPTKDYVFSVEEGDLGQDQSSFLFRSDPRGIRIWIGQESPFIPLKMVFTKPFSVVTMVFQNLTYNV